MGRSSTETKAMEVLRALEKLDDADLRCVLSVAQEYADHPSIKGGVVNGRVRTVPAGRKLIVQLSLALKEVTGWEPMDRSRLW